MTQTPGKELDHDVARRFMNWKQLKDYNYWMTFQKDGFELNELIASWSPSTNRKHAQVVLEELKRRGISVTDDSPLGICLTALGSLP